MTPAQPSLFDEAALPPLVSVPHVGLTPAEQLAEYDRLNPHIYRAFRQMAIEDYVDGHLRLYAMEYIYRIRKAGTRALKDANGYRIPNRFATYCVRRLCEDSPRVAALFVLRPSELDN